MAETKSTQNEKVRILCEAALTVAVAIVLSYFKIQFLAAGSISFVMIPIILFSVRRGWIWGVSTGAVFGLLKYILAGGFAWNLASILLDYAVAYGAVGLAGVFKGKKYGLLWGSMLGCFARYIVHFISGITIYAITAPTELFGVTWTNMWLYSLVYNISYMLPSTVIAVVVCALLMKPLDKFLKGERV